jgi:NTP pyrophosphatase (non-canonical NTP hydrolase)
MYVNIDIEKLKRAKEKLEDLKALKFSLSASKHKNDKYGFPDLLCHYRDELRELEDALLKGATYQRIKEELADISNMIDLMFEYLERFDGGETRRK